MKKMTSKERVCASLNREEFDRLPVKHEGTPEINKMLREHFGLINDEQLRVMLGDDLRYIGPRYCGPELKIFPDGSKEGYWGERYASVKYAGGEYTESCYLPYEDIETLDELDRSHFPSADWFDYTSIKSECEELCNRGLAICIGSAGDMNFINGTARTRGVEQVLIDLGTDNEVYLEMMEHRFKFYMEMHERILRAGGGMIDIAHVGDDLGSQICQLISHKCFNTHFSPKYKEYFEMAHSYGVKTMMHMCGCVREFLPKLIEIGLDIYDVVQPTTANTDIEVLQKDFGGKLNFCGSICVQKTLTNATPREIENEIGRRKRIFSGGGIIIGPSHAIQVGSPLENILTMYRSAGSMKESIDDEIEFLKDYDNDRMKNMSKLW